MILTFSFKTTNYGFPHLTTSGDFPLWMKGPYGGQSWGLCDLPGARVGPRAHRSFPRLEVKLSKSTYQWKQFLLTTLPKATQNPKLGVISKLTPFQLRGCLSSLYLLLPPRTSSWTHAVGCRAINLFLIPKGLSPVKIYFLHSDFCLISNFWHMWNVKNIRSLYLL